MKKYSILFLPAILFLFSCSNINDESKNESNDSARVQGASMSHEEMEMKEMAEKQKNEAPKGESPYRNAKIDIKVFENKEANITGFGYDILIYDALYVHQPHIPAINGNRGFKAESQAKIAAEFVVYKIRNNIMPPSLSVQELDSLGTLK